MDCIPLYLPDIHIEKDVVHNLDYNMVEVAVVDPPAVVAERHYEPPPFQIMLPLQKFGVVQIQLLVVAHDDTWDVHHQQRH